VIVDSALHSGGWTYLVVFAVTVAETSAFLGLIIPGETLAVAAGVVAGRGHLDVTGVVIAVICGATTGDVVGYTLGRRAAGLRAAGRSRRGLPKKMSPVRAILARRGGVAVFCGRFVGFLRPFIPFTAGLSRMGFRRFLSASVPAALIWGVGTVLVGFFLGSSAEQVLSWTGTAAPAALAAALLILIPIVWARRRRRALAMRRDSRNDGSAVGSGSEEQGSAVGDGSSRPAPSPRHPVAESEQTARPGRHFCGVRR
jgi:membrane-associated protein